MILHTVSKTKYSAAVFFSLMKINAVIHFAVESQNVRGVTNSVA